MSITIELAPEVEARLTEEAQARGLAVEEYAQRILERDSRPRLPEPKQLSDEEFFAAIERMGQYSDKIPPMPNETFSREMIYQDHD